jgi:hypothetical protein
MHEVVNHVELIVEQLAATTEETESLGGLSDESVNLIRRAGVTRSTSRARCITPRR